MNFSSQSAEKLSDEEYEIEKAMEEAKKKPAYYRVKAPYYLARPDYSREVQRSRTDFSRNIPLKCMDEFPNSGNEGLYGLTWLGEIKMQRNERLRCTLKGRETDVHECIHTEWEYETRVLTWWMMQNEDKDKKYLLN